MSPPASKERKSADWELTYASFPIKPLTGELILTLAVLAGMGWSAFDSYRNFVAGQQQNLRLAELRGVIAASPAIRVDRKQ